MPHDAKVDIAIYNTLGQRVETLIAEKRAAGDHVVSWDGTDYAGGLYFCRMKSNDFQQTIKLLLIK